VLPDPEADLGEILAEWLEAWELGAPLDPGTFLAAHLQHPTDWCPT
jgi:hypothetical protein